LELKAKIEQLFKDTVAAHKTAIASGTAYSRMILQFEKSDPVEFFKKNKDALDISRQSKIDINIAYGKWKEFADVIKNVHGQENVYEKARSWENFWLQWKRYRNDEISSPPTPPQ
jgi:hypothetical protein